MPVTQPDQPVSLTQLRAGAKGIVESVAGGHLLVRRLAALGIIAGTAVEMIAGNRSGPAIVQVRGGRVALGRGAAGRIVVRVVVGDRGKEAP